MANDMTFATLKFRIIELGLEFKVLGFRVRIGCNYINRCVHSYHFRRIGVRVRVLEFRVKRNDMKVMSLKALYCNSRIWIDNTRLFFQPPTTTRMTSNVVVKQLVLFTMLQHFLIIYEK